VDTNTPRASAYLILAGLVLSVAGALLVDSSVTDSTVAGHAPAGAWVGGLLVAAGVVAIMAGFLRWGARSRRAAESTPARTPAAV
jgi:hypothetical protein